MMKQTGSSDIGERTICKQVDGMAIRKGREAHGPGQTA